MQLERYVKAFANTTALINEISQPWATLIYRRHKHLEEQGISNIRFFDKLSQNAL